MQIERAYADIEVFDLKTAYLGRSHSLLICPPNEYVTAIKGGHLYSAAGPTDSRNDCTPVALSPFDCLKMRIDKIISIESRRSPLTIRRNVKHQTAALKNE